MEKDDLDEIRNSLLIDRNGPQKSLESIDDSYLTRDCYFHTGILPYAGCAWEYIRGISIYIPADAEFPVCVMKKILDDMDFEDEYGCTREEYERQSRETYYEDDEDDEDGYY